MARVARVVLPLGALAFLGAFAWQDAKIAKLAPLIGDWDVKLDIEGPGEVAGTYHGTAKFSWEPNKQHIRAQGSLKSDKTTHGTGFLSFDDDGADRDHSYRGAFLWADDGRILTLRGNFKGKDIVFDGTILASDANKDLKLRVTTDLGQEKILVQVDALAESKWVRFLEVELTRKNR